MGLVRVRLPLPFWLALLVSLTPAGGQLVSMEKSDPATPPISPPSTPPIQTPAPVIAPTQVLLQAPFALTHVAYHWQQVAGDPLTLPAEPGASVRVNIPAPGTYAWRVTAGDGRFAAPPVEVRLVVLADGDRTRWAIPYVERLALRPGDRFAVDLRAVAVVGATAMGGTGQAGMEAPDRNRVDLSRGWTLTWDKLEPLAGGGDPLDQMDAWALPDSAGPRVRLFQVPATAAGQSFTLQFHLRAGDRELHAGRIRLEVAPPLTAPAGPTVAATQVVAQGVTAVLAAAKLGPGAPVVALPYGEETLTVHLQERIDLDGRLCSDPDGDPLTYHWWQTRAPSGGVGGTTSFTILVHPALWRWQPVREQDIGIHEFVLSVSDGAHLVYSRPVRVKVEPAAAQPAAQIRVSAPPQQVVEVNQEVQLQVQVEQQGRGGGDWLPDFRGAEPRWAQKTRPPGILRIDPADALSRFQPYFRADQPGLYELEFSVSAAETISNTVLVRVQVLAANRPPGWLFADGPVATGRVDQPVVLDWPARDPDGDPLQFELRALDGPATTAVKIEPEMKTVDGVATVAVRFHAPDPGLYRVEASVSDGRAFSPTGSALVWMRAEEPFGPFVIAGPAEARVGEALEVELTGAGSVQQFVRWQARGGAGEGARWQDGREGGRKTVVFDRAGTAELQARVWNGLGRAVVVSLAVQVMPAVQAAPTAVNAP